MKLLTLNFLTCAVKSCKPQPAAFPLHIRDAELELVSSTFNPLLLRNLLPRLDRKAVRETATEVGLELPDGFDEDEVEEMDVDGTDVKGKAREHASDEAMLKELHTLLIETQISNGKLVCGLCGHEYAIKEGIPNFLLPPHLV